MAVVSQKTGKRTREKIIAKVDRMPLAYFDAHQIGDSLSLVTNDTDALIQAIANSFSTVISSTVSIVALSVIMFMKN
jgi:ATP-binding cassette subfamily B protein